MERTVKLTTYGPNHGLTLDIGTYHFENGVCEISEKDAGSAASVLCRYHDVCFEHELEAKLAEYKTIAEQNAQAAVSTPIPEPIAPIPTSIAPINPDPVIDAPVEPTASANPAEPELFAPNETAPAPEAEGEPVTPPSEPAVIVEPAVTEPPTAPAPEAEQPKPQGNKRQNKQS